MGIGVWVVCVAVLGRKSNIILLRFSPRYRVQSAVAQEFRQGQGLSGIQLCL